ncbi:hypothetical protein BH10ACT7_BH10ACT7_05550 [soil metagenome]
MPKAIDSFKASMASNGYVVLSERTEAERVLNYLGPATAPVRLEARSQRDSKEWSHSGRYGLGTFPWHTDGAVSSSPPRWILMRCLEDDSQTPTELVNPTEALLLQLRRVTLMVRNARNKVTYFPAVSPGAGGQSRLRWDPRIATPIRGQTDLVDRAEPTARIFWSEDMTLVIDNYRVLHRRPQVADNAQRVLTRQYAGV